MTVKHHAELYLTHSFNLKQNTVNARVSSKQVLIFIDYSDTCSRNLRKMALKRLKSEYFAK